MEALQRLHNRGSISTGYDIDNSCKFEADNNEWFYNSSPTAGNRRTFTFSFWIKRSALGTVNASGTQYVAGQGQHGRMYFGSDYFQFRFDDGHDVRDVTTKHTDPAAWLHVVVAVDTNQSSSSNRVKIYFNGVQTTTIDHDGGSYPDIEDQGAWFNTNYLTLGTAPFGGSYSAGDGDYDMRGYLADFAAVDGTQYAPTAFGEFDEDTGIWKPKDLSAITWGSEGFYLKFDDSSNMGKDSSGNSNNLTANNIAAADQATDTPTNNFALINTLQGNNSNLTITNGATSLIKSGDHGWQTTSANMAVRKGKWYAEFKLDTNATLIMLGVNQIEDDVAWNGSYIGAYSNSTARGMAYYSQTGSFYRNGGSGAIGSTYAAGDIIGIALCINDNLTGFMGMHRNGTWQNSQDPSAGTTNMLGLEYGNAIEEGIHYTFAISNHEGTGKVLANFGGFDGFTVSSGNADANGYGNFEYAPPTGYYALCTKNLEEFA